MFSPSSKDPVRRLAECWDTEPASSLFPLEVFSSVGGAKLKDIHGASGKRRGEAQRTGHGGPAQELSVIPGHGTCAWRLAWPWSPAGLQRGTEGRGRPEPPPLVRGRRARPWHCCQAAAETWSSWWLWGAGGGTFSVLWTFGS